jgi:hypothetical protein
MKTSNKIFRFLLGMLSIVMLAFTAYQIVTGQSFAWGDLSAPGLAMAFTYGDLTFEDEHNNMGGLTTVMYIGLSKDIATWPLLPSNPTGYAEKVTLTGSFAMNASAKFIEVYATPETAKLEPENQGEVDGQSFRQKGEFLYPGTLEEAIGFAAAINNARGCIIGIDPNTGKRYVVGSKDRPVYFKPSVTTGGAAADRRGVKIEFWSDSFVPFAFYTGAIPLSDGDIPALS